MLRRTRRNRGFSILELAVVNVVIAVLCTIAIPQFMMAINRANDAEAVVTLSAIERLMLVYYNNNGQYPPKPGAQDPPDPTSAGKTAWLEGQPGWSDINFSSDGQVYLYRYAFTPTLDPVSGQYSSVTITATAAFDGVQPTHTIQLQNGEEVLNEVPAPF